MAMSTQRFGVRNAGGARSSEWVVMWKKNTSDVYLATRTLGGSMKLSLHASGRCHVRAPDSQQWRGSGLPPAFLDAWDIDVNQTFQFPFAIVFPLQELRAGEWAAHKEKGTMWIELDGDESVEIALLLVRAEGDQTARLGAAGWKAVIVDAELPDGRRLLVVAGTCALPKDKLAELEDVRRIVQTHAATLETPSVNLRVVVLAGPNEQGTRKFVEVSGNVAT